ncbi:hypothetical protein Zmor_007393 [Zophobas morio]|uniref:Uncharacterized protein n=1 Tax=Zophobas morio TaxID=2755281 RepID=A0AA38MP95_9CUCU|nr:hypothetical protein Zmor_007393 [Zophobas morio]
MRILLCLLLVIPAVLTAATHTNCIIGCKCDEDVIIARKLKIRECDSPLILTKSTLTSVSKKITVISYRNVVIKRIEGDAFTGFNELESVIIQDANIESIDPRAFDLPELGTITFTKTTFGESPNLNSTYLEELIFNDCKLSRVPNLDNLPGLSFLSLTNNLIHTIDESTFSKAENLEEINLANNSISELSPNLFINNPDFNVLNLDYNPLKSFDFNFESDLEFLSLRHCKLTTFDRRTSENLSLLSSLDLSGNEISILPLDAFEPMKDLNNLDLSNNKLVELDDNIFYENSKLNRIIMDNNPFHRLPHFETKEKTFQTYTFSCKNCSLRSVKGVFDNMRGLVTLDLSYNKLKDIDGVFTEMSGIKEIFLSHNKISSIGVNSFRKKSELETLDLSNNPLLPLDPVFFTSLPLLKKLNVSGSGLKSLWANHNAILPSMEQLFVDQNRLPGITVSDMKVLPNLKLIDVHGNPLRCTQDLYDLIRYLTEKSIVPQDPTVRTHEETKYDTTIIFSPKRNWKSILPTGCPFEDDLIGNKLINKDEEDYDDDDDDDEEEDIDGDDYTAYDKVEEDENESFEESVTTARGFNLTKMSYILSISSVFILTALLVLFVAVMVTLMILKRNKSFNMHNGNLPRVKIPLWHTVQGHKKHSGSVYRPLTEEFSGSRTPIINRYEFKQIPQVHNSQSQ